MQINVQQSGSSFTRNILFVVLLIVSLVLFAVYGQEGEGGALHGAQSAFMSATGQVASVGAGVGAATEQAEDSLSDATADPTTLAGLRDQNQELRELLADAEEYRQENERLRGLLDIKQVSGVTGPVARVIGRSTNAWDQSITIDIGSADGVTSGMTVMGSSGVIGQVSRANEHNSTVRLLTDPNSGAAVMVQSTRANGIVRGSLNGLLYLEDIDEDAVPVEGDVILTSGLGGSYERGLIVGAVASVGDASTGGTPSIVINPNASAAMLEEVIVVFKAPQTISANSANGSSGSASAQTDGQAQDLSFDQIANSDVTATSEDGESGQYDQYGQYEGYDEDGYGEDEGEDYGDDEGAQDDGDYTEG